MELVLQQGLPHQQKAVDAVCKVFDRVGMFRPAQFYENPGINFKDSAIEKNIRLLQLDIPAEYRGIKVRDDCMNLDVKMETGTGKTYVYTKVIHELHRRYSMNKFIIAVPSLSIKAGTEQFLRENYVRRHFSDICGYDDDIVLEVLETPKHRKKGRTFFPGAVSDFVKGSCQNSKKIYVLLLNMQLLTNAKILSRDDYDCEVEGFYQPMEALRATKPIVIIDEPHRFSRKQKAYKVISERIKPQCIIRFGATFPEVTAGVRDYENLLYDLNACKAFNQNLIKGVVKEHLEPVSKREEKVKITAIVNKESVSFRYEKRNESSRTFTLKVNDSLSVISKEFEGLTVSAIGKKNVEFSNGITKLEGEALDVDIYMTSYQEMMIRLALKRHFQTERENFSNRQYKIKTLALFFIDDIASYRENDNGKRPYLLQAFERLLKEQLQQELDESEEYEQEYKAYLRASLSDISACHAGYFSQDNSDSDEAIAQEVDVILHGKKELLSIYNVDGSYNTLRFLFSKWTLKEGWDNPNIFTIAKLRSSGSENSKLQEVGRGLRLPVDENGNRISNEDFWLNYIVDFTEADFAQKLVDQINGDVPEILKLSLDKLRLVSENMGITANHLFKELLYKEYIDYQYNIIPENRNQFFEEYPDFAVGLQNGRIKDRNKEQEEKVHVREEVFGELKNIWEAMHQRYLLFYDEEVGNDLEDSLSTIFEQAGIFSDVVITSKREEVKSDGGFMNIVRETGVQYVLSRPIPYNDFLKKIMRATNLPIQTIHKAICIYVRKHGGIRKDYFNDSSVSAFCAEFQNWKIERLRKHFKYVKIDVKEKMTVLTDADGRARHDIAGNKVGSFTTLGATSERYLYDTIVYDSPLEKENIMTHDDAIVAYGKIPKGSVAIPTITGGMYSPDFMCVAKSDNGKKRKGIVIETKAVENKTELRGTELAKIECADAFFKMVSENGDKVHFRTQLNNQKMGQIIQEVLLET